MAGSSWTTPRGSLVVRVGCGKDFRMALLRKVEYSMYSNSSGSTGGEGRW